MQPLVQPFVESNTRNQCDKWGLPLKISQRTQLHKEAVPVDQQVNDAFLVGCMDVDLSSLEMTLHLTLGCAAGER